MDSVISQFEGQDYMNALQLAYFRERLNSMKLEISERQAVMKNEDQEDISSIADPLDRASAEEARQASLKARERDMLRLREINAALARIEEGEFGYCEESGEEIGIRRLIAYPAARLSLEAQEAKERQGRFTGR